MNFPRCTVRTWRAQTIDTVDVVDLSNLTGHPCPKIYRVGQKSKLLCSRLSVMDQFKEIPLLESLLNFQKDKVSK